MDLLEKVCTGFLNYNCISCDYFSRDLPDVCVKCPGNVQGDCADCVSFRECAYKAAKIGCASVYGCGVCEDAQT